MNIIIIGAQGSGKGTQADRLAPRIGAVKLSTGDLFRAEIAAQSPLGLEVEQTLRSGKLVADVVTLGMVERRLDEIAGQVFQGVIFDGFPRNAAQAAALDELLAKRGQRIDVVIELSVPEEVLIERLGGRRVCSECGADFNIAFMPTRVPGICDKCGGKLFKRPDDEPDAIRNRLKAYSEQTEPLLDFYDGRGLLVTIDGNQDVQLVHQAIVDAIATAPVNSEA